MALADYARLTVFYDGEPLTQVTSIQMTTTSGQNRVDLLVEGLGGFTPGSGDVSITIGFAVPIKGTEKPFQADCANGRFVTMQIQEGARYYIGQGKHMTEEVSSSVGSNTEGSLNWTGELKAMEG